jgi:hypothetical protein
VQPPQRQGIGNMWARGGIGQCRLAVDLALVHCGAAQETRLLVGVIRNHLQREAHRFVATAGELQQQPVGVVELGAPVRSGREFLDIGAAKVTRFDGGTKLGKGGLHTAGVEIFVEQQAHGGKW